MRINRLKKVIKVFLIILAILLIIVIAIVGCALITYHKQPVLTEEDKEELSVDNIWKTRTEPEMAEVIEDNGDALLERIKLISNARDEIILSTFDFRADDSGKLILGALLDASERGVSVNVIVDGVSGFLRMMVILILKRWQLEKEQALRYIIRSIRLHHGNLWEDFMISIL